MSHTAVVSTLVGFLVFALGVPLPRLQTLFESLLRNPRPPQAPDVLPERPSIAVIVPAYLESSVIPGTLAVLRSALAGYEGPSSIVVVASDPGTAAAARQSGADAVVESAREGKPAATNRGVEATRADIIVFTDANCEIRPSDWPHTVVEELREWHVVSANKVERGARESLFWRTEKSTKAALSASVGSLSVIGEMIAMRRSDFVPLPADAICDDLWLACAVADSGKRVKIAPALHTIEDPATNREQWGRRVRIVEGLYKEQVPRVLHHMRSRIGRAFLAHKIYRVTIGPLGFWLMIGSLAALLPPISLVVLPFIGGLVALYAGMIAPASRLGSFVAAIGMQAVPLAGLWRLGRSRRRSADVRPTGWAKVPR